jgi:hypothetical protein
MLMLRSRRQDHAWWLARMTNDDMQRLATYNAEKWRGIAHTAEYDDEMRSLQDAWDAMQQERQSC